MKGGEGTMTSAARKKAKMHEKLVETLEEKISELVPKISKAETTLIAVHNTFTNGGAMQKDSLCWSLKNMN